ncbi:AMIN-like domain-containing (lipo)protein [Ornithinimicrobium cerasi]|uniref:AMIN-like domain-containing (lipo)protein n=1 Tax=Ornithinimicrobium cerasi TaxID=2248773 RepID=UPI001379EB3C|nr:hypothetical protein [Ornithinimicrobium cerasi]
MRRALGATVVALLVLSGCESAGDDDGQSPPTTTTGTSAPAETSSEGPTSEDPSSEEPTSDDATDEPTETSSGTGDATSTGDTGDIPSEPDPDRYPWVGGPVEEETRAGAEGQEITDVRTGLHEGYDRVVLDLTGEEPALGWFVSFVDEAVEDPSGLPLDVDGDAFLQVVVRGIDWTTESPERYDGDPVEGAGTEVVTEVVLGGLFEGQQQIVIGLTQETAFRVFSLPDPARIVIDVQHP